jgi:hypothetical protein
VWHFELKYRSSHSDGISGNQPCQCGARARGSRDCSSLCISRSWWRSALCSHAIFIRIAVFCLKLTPPTFPHGVRSAEDTSSFYNVACEQYCNFTDRMAPFYDRQMLLDANSNWLTASSNVTSTFTVWEYSIHTSHQLLLKETGIVWETSAHFSILTRMLAQQDFVLLLGQFVPKVSVWAAERVSPTVLNAIYVYVWYIRSFEEIVKAKNMYSRVYHDITYYNVYSAYPLLMSLGIWVRKLFK